DKIDVLLLGDDFGTQTGPLIGLESFREFFKRPLREMIELCHKYNIRTMLHSCGSVKIFIPDLIEIGLDILNPVQHTAFEMDLRDLKREFGKDICFHGAIDVQKVLPFGSKKDIENEVKTCIEILGANGGYICAPSHNLQSDVPVENIIYMYEYARSIR
ncbi:MAG TPA: uroporphyrinogen decarboxylase family protein, partial [bacterium]|nr:uroporphyrinogen decarboxylase family protein [bacterium]